MKFYTGIGARKTPPEILERFAKLSLFLSDRGWTLRSGGADGADSAFESCARNKEIFLPWRGFNGNNGQLFTLPEEAFLIAQRHHPNWDNLSQAVKKLMARNVQQILGPNLDNPSKFVVCWTPNGELVGGTALALKVAIENKVKIFNFAVDNHPRDLYNYLKCYE